MPDQMMARIDAMSMEGMSLDDIEEWIEARQDMSEEARSALWLYAWATQPDGQAREEARRTVLMLA